MSKKEDFKIVPYAVNKVMSLEELIKQKEDDAKRYNEQTADKR
jgi:hypothetical protein